MPPRKRKPASAAPAPPTTATVTVIHGNSSREIPYKPYRTVWALLADAIRAHGKKFADNSHLRLHNADGAELSNVVAIQNAGIQAGHTLELRAPKEANTT